MSTNRSDNHNVLIGGILLIALGVLTLLGQLFRNFDFWHYLWPFIVIGIGGLFFAGMLLLGKQWAFLAIPGSIITVSGAMLMVQNITAYWESWSYGWTITIFAIGLGIYLMGAYQENEKNRLGGVKVMKVGLVLFVVFGALFELILSPSRFQGAEIVFPILLIVLGGYLIVARLVPFGRGETKGDTL